MTVEIPSVEAIQETLSNRDLEKVDIVQRMKALFYARHHDTPAALNAIVAGLWHPSVLLRHEICYCMGQMRQPMAADTLVELLEDTQQHPMVRHEAGEALGALGLFDSTVFETLSKYEHDPEPAVSETCQLASIALRKKLEKSGGKVEEKKDEAGVKSFFLFTGVPLTVRVLDKVGKSKFGSCDPAEGDERLEKAELIGQVKALLLNESAKLWDRYVAMFTLRNINTEASGAALAEGLKDKTSALLRHQICFVLGQMQYSNCIDALCSRLGDKGDATFVRHEAAIALGSVGAGKSTAERRAARMKAIDMLQKYSKDSDQTVADSCIVGLANIEQVTGSLGPL